MEIYFYLLQHSQTAREYVINFVSTVPMKKIKELLNDEINIDEASRKFDLKYSYDKRFSILKPFIILEYKLYIDGKQKIHKAAVNFAYYVELKLSEDLYTNLEFDDLFINLKKYLFTYNLAHQISVFENLIIQTNKFYKNNDRCLFYKYKDKEFHEIIGGK